MFGHLHLHSTYSVLDGMGKIEEIFDRAKQLGQPFVAITDHGSTSALWEAQKHSERTGVKLIYGTEFYYEREMDGKNGHLIALAMNNNGLSNIFKMQTLSYTENFYRKPRINFEILSAHHEDIIFTTACLANDASQYIMQGNIPEAERYLRKYKDLLGDRFYIEIQSNSILDQVNVNKELIKLADKLDIEVIVTNDAHYVLESDAPIHEVLLALQMNHKMDSPKRFKFPTNDFWMKSVDEVIKELLYIPPDKMERYLKNTQVIADRCDVRIEKGHFLPHFYKDVDERQELINNVIEGAKKRDSKLLKDKEFMSAVQEEIDVIDRNGYSGYFLIVADFVNHAKRSKILVGDGRGSGAGSKVAWLTKITEIPPHKYDLLFERFLADGREPDLIKVA